MVASSYPRPQFVRQEWQSLDGFWQYAFSPTANPASVNWLGEIRVPFPPESPLSGVHDPSFHPLVWYRCIFLVPQAWQGQRLMLHFGAVDYSAQVWLNGRLVVEHEGGHTPFSADITEVLVQGEQELIVRAADNPCDLEKPRGKQDWEEKPHAIWYPRTSGIWQPVWLEPVPEICITRLRLTPEVESFTIGMDLEVGTNLLDSPEGLSLDVQLTLHGETLVRDTHKVGGYKGRYQIVLPAPQSDLERKMLLWSPENPILFDLLLTLHNDRQILDQVHSYAALRSVEARAGAFYLNGQPYFLQMVLDQGYWVESHLAAPSGEALRQDVELTKAMGFNGVRKHQKIEDPRYLYWADRLGLLVWGELPSAYSFSGEAARRLTSEFIAMIERDYNHPCLMAWVPFNESWGIPDVSRSVTQRHLAHSLYHLAKTLDPTRLVIENDGWEHCGTDLFTIHDYENDPQVYAYRYGTPAGLEDAILHYTRTPKWIVEGFSPQGLPVVLSEFGGIRLGNEGPGWGYAQVQTPDDFLQLFAPLMKAVYGKVLTGFCYTQLTDTFQEQNGLLYADRRPKVDPQIIAGILQDGLRQRSLEPA